ncbi:MAG TPA: NAD(P)H-dependent oxidoreductase subunit E [Tissierellaceae bacterium]|nr:NAD(P)H-dependent oxidoreductase subunit E [Tissierellaceae bacterium]
MLKREIMETIDTIIDEHDKKPSSIISILQGVQREYRYLPEEVIYYLADQMDISASKIYGIATFYENFSLEPKGKHIIKICDGTACHIRKSQPILDALRAELNLTEDKRTTDDLLITVEMVSCLGACSLAPVVNVDGLVYAKMTPNKTQALVKKIKEEGLNEDRE